MEYGIETDGKGQRYIEIALADEEKLRVTFLSNTWMGKPGVRVQEKSGAQLKQGPEVSIDKVGELISCIFELVLDSTS